MNRKEDIDFLESFRDKVDEYLYLGYAPAEPLPLMEGSDYYEFKDAVAQPKFKKLRKEINEMIPRVEQLIVKLNIGFILIYSPAPITGRPPVRMNLFDIMLNNTIEKDIDKSDILDRIDQAIGHLKAWKETEQNIKQDNFQSETQKGFVFIAMPMNPDNPALVDVHETIKRVALNLNLIAERVDDPESNEKITKRIIEAIRKAEYIVADLTDSKPNVFFEAGYAEGMGKIPIYIARSGTLMEFDLKDYPIIFFRNLKELEEKLTKRLKGISS